MHTARIKGNPRTLQIGKVVCLARNYTEHARELGNETPEKPVLFIKPASSIIGHQETVIIPDFSRECHHEVELAVLIGRFGKKIGAKDAFQHVAGYGVGLDMTLRDVQTALKQKGLPWEIAKGFDTACPLSDFVPASQVADPHNLRISLKVNDQLRQNGSTARMIFGIPRIIEAVSEVFTLEEGDVILTGTPSGVGAVHSGDRMLAEIEQVGKLEIWVQ